MPTRPPLHLEQAWGLLAGDPEWPGHDAKVLDDAAAECWRMAADADFAAEDTYAGVRAVVEANEGTSVAAFADYGNHTLIPGTARLAEVLRATALAYGSMAGHIREAKSELDRHVDPLNDDIRRAAAEWQGIALSPSDLRELPAVKYTSATVWRISSGLEERLTKEIKQLRDLWLNGGSGMIRAKLAVGSHVNGLVFDPRGYEEGASRLAQAAEDMSRIGGRHDAARGRVAQQFREWTASIPAAASLEELEAEVADAIRGCVADLRYTNDNIIGSCATLLETEEQNVELFRQFRVGLYGNDGRGTGGFQEPGSGAPGRISRILNGSVLVKDAGGSQMGRGYREHPYGVIGDTPE